MSAPLMYPMPDRAAAEALSHQLWDVHRPPELRAEDEITDSMGAVIEHPISGEVLLVLDADEAALLPPGSLPDVELPTMEQATADGWFVPRSPAELAGG